MEKSAVQEVARKEYFRRAAWMKERLRTDEHVDSRDREDLLLAMEAAVLFEKSGVIRHGVNKLFCEDMGSQFRYLSSLGDYDGEDRDFFFRTACILSTMYSDREEKTKQRTSRKKG